MARVTVEDCVDKVKNRFELVLLAAHRARQISQGTQVAVERNNDKNPVVALREIADKVLSPADLKDALIHSLQKHVEVDEPEITPELIAGDSILARGSSPEFALEEDKKDDSSVSFDFMSEAELLAGIESLVAPEKSEDY